MREIDKKTEKQTQRGGRGREAECKHVWVKHTVIISQARKMRQMALDLQLKRKELTIFIFTWRNNAFKILQVSGPFGLCGVQDPVRGAPL